MMLTAAARVAVTGIIASQFLSQSLPTGLPDGREFVVQISPTVSAGSCHVASLQSGEFGGIVGAPVRDAGDGVLAIRTGVAGKPATSLKAALWCRGFAMALVDVALSESSTYRHLVRLSPIAPIEIAGQVQPPADGVSLAGATLRVWYVADWLCGFFNLQDCGVPQWEVAVGRIGPNGEFRIQVPDFFRDPTVRSQPLRPPFGSGSFRLRADREVAPHHYWLEPAGAPPGLVNVAATYPQLRWLPRRH